MGASPTGLPRTSCGNTSRSAGAEHHNGKHQSRPSNLPPHTRTPFRRLGFLRLSRVAVLLRLRAPTEMSALGGMYRDWPLFTALAMLASIGAFRVAHDAGGG